LLFQFEIVVSYVAMLIIVV